MDEGEQAVVNRVIGAHLGGKSGVYRMEHLRRRMERDRAEKIDGLRLENRCLAALLVMRSASARPPKVMRTFGL